MFFGRLRHHSKSLLAAQTYANLFFLILLLITHRCLFITAVQCTLRVLQNNKHLCHPMAIYRFQCLWKKFLFSLFFPSKRDVPNYVAWIYCFEKSRHFVLFTIKPTWLVCRSFQHLLY